MKHKSNEKKVGEIVMVKVEDKQRDNWKIGRTDWNFVGKDGFIKSVWIKTAKGFLEWPFQLLYQVDLDCDNIIDDSNETELGMINRVTQTENSILNL